MLIFISHIELDNDRRAVETSFGFFTVIFYQQIKVPAIICIFSTGHLVITPSALVIMTVLFPRELNKI